MQEFIRGYRGLTSEEVAASRQLHGKNLVEGRGENHFLSALKGALTEPMLILLAAASTIYFIYGEEAEAIFLAVAILLVASISLYQETRSRYALEALKAYTQPLAKVIRNKEVLKIASEQIVVGDYIVIEEGELIPADAEIVQSNDFSVNESIVTGESLPVYKSVDSSDKGVYEGTMVVSGLAICVVNAIGSKTKIGQIGKSLEELQEEKSPLQIQIADFVKKMAIIGGIIFLAIWLVNFINTDEVLGSLLKALTLAMSILPEEIPVAFATFMALGMWRLMKLGVIVRKMQTVETLGSTNIICIDKTGTITKNEMTLAKIYVHDARKVCEPHEDETIGEVVTLAMWASEPIPFDPMEIALHAAYGRITKDDLRKSFTMVHEYPLGGQPPLMTHIFKNNSGQQIIAAKGAPEAVLRISTLPSAEQEEVLAVFAELAEKGYRVLAVAEDATHDSEYPESQDHLSLSFKGLIAFYDPPKDNIESVLHSFYEAGINVKIVTGDNATTTQTIADQINFKGQVSITGDELMKQSDQAFRATVNSTNIFSRMFPEAKLKIINALKDAGHIVAMTGDGVNDGPALKAANIGIAMGKKGSEVARQAADLVLSDDDLVHLVDAVAMGRKIYNNLKKAVQYIISIHIPIILIVFIPLVLGWVYPAIFTPVHVIFLELIMGPTCSIIYENEPIEQNLMRQGPRQFTRTFFKINELSVSIIQGIAITVAIISVYWYAAGHNESLETTTAMVFVALVVANVVLTLVNRSHYYSILTTMRYRNMLIPLVVIVTIMLVVIIFAIPGIRSFFQFDIPTLGQSAVAVASGAVSVIWYEGVKYFRRRTNRHLPPHASMPG